MGRKKKEFSFEECEEKLVSGEGYYVTNEALMEELAVCHRPEVDNVTNKMAIMFQSIATKLASSKKLPYKTEEDKEDCVQRGVLDCLKYWRGFFREPLPMVGEDCKLVYDNKGEIVTYQPEYTMDDIPSTPIVYNEEVTPDMVIWKVKDRKTVRVVLLNPDGTVKMKKPNPFAYFTELCKNGIAKGWRELGYMDMPFSNRVYISDSIYSL